MPAQPNAPQIDPQQSFPALEEGVLARWAERDVFKRSMQQREGAQPWVFWEGPPTANGKPGVHHVLSRVFKDIFPRYRTMRGFHVERRGGWDCHGLPVEIAVEKQLGLSSKHEIENIVPGDVRASIEQFNTACRDSVFTFLEDWDALTQRIGFWVDLDAAYRTMDTSYVESVWAALKQMHDRELLYQGNKVVPFCTRCGTALSSHEVALGYKDIKDTSAYVRLPVVADQLRPARRCSPATRSWSGRRRRGRSWRTSRPPCTRTWSTCACASQRRLSHPSRASQRQATGTRFATRKQASMWWPVSWSNRPSLASQREFLVAGGSRAIPSRATSSSAPCTRRRSWRRVAAPTVTAPSSPPSS